MVICSRHPTERHAHAIIDRVTALLQVCPSSAFTLAGLPERRGRRLHIAFIFTASEPLHPHQRAPLADRLGGRSR
jgi:phenylacetate-CoA ligase